MKITHHNTVADWPDVVMDIGAGLQAGHMPVVLEDKADFVFDRVEDTPFQD